MTTWEERVAHLSERWATSSRPHRNPPTLPATSHPIETRHPSVFPAKAGNHAPPPSSPAMSPTANQPNPKNHPNQTNNSRGSPCGCPRAPQPAIPPTRPTTRLSGESRNPRTPQLSKTPSPLQPNGNSHPSRLSGESRKPRNPNSQEQPGNTSLTATPTPPVIPTKAGNHATPTPRNSPATPAELQLSPLPSFRRKPESTYPQLSRHQAHSSLTATPTPPVIPTKSGTKQGAKSGKNDVAHLPRGGQLVLPRSPSRQ